MIVIAALTWPILERIPLVGGLEVSPHGISIALGVLLGAEVMRRRARRRGVARRVGPDPDRTVEALLVRAVIGGIVGARFFYVVTRLDQFPDPLGWFTVWHGGLSLLGGITGAVLAGLPYVVRRRLSVRLVLDSVAPGLALGIFIGRIGDLVIGEHLGGRTDFVLGWRCSGALRDAAAPYPWPGPTAQGCFDVAVHQTALYDFLLGGAVFATLLVLERRPRFDGFFMAAFVLLYGSGRLVTDFARAADKDLIGMLTGSQVTALLTIAAVIGWITVSKPARRTPWGWSPPDFDHHWGSGAGSAPGDSPPGAASPVDDATTQHDLSGP
ncbi:MAG: prolipoprotein diacylglyceryl transferase [Actinomycetota bacterium]|jgi:phosphatidylglycerol:prolipoprotein diacylglycerol transferase|uniref:prolipoprotein diacylglyceryl transferase n=1 Tax=Euzebya pacifica TaxID=1608957 RepID=UPI0030FB3313